MSPQVEQPAAGWPDSPRDADRPGREWFLRPVLEVAHDLLGTSLVHRSAEGTVVLRLTEVEAYGGADDPGSHAYRGVTPRNRSMVEDGGHLYAYRHLGLHTCLNVVTGPAGSPAAVLLRGAEVVEGAEVALRRRTQRGVVRADRDLARGPARLSVALGVGADHDGDDLVRPDSCLTLHLGRSTTPAGGEAARHGVAGGDPSHDVVRAAVSRGPRVGVSGAGGDGELHPWRLWLTGEPTVSAYRAVSARRR